MKKIMLSIICLLALSNFSKLQADEWYDIGVDVSTVAFSSSTAQAFLGRGLVYGVGCSSSSVNSYFELFDSSSAIDLALGDTQDGRRKYRISNYSIPQTSTSTIASGDYWFQRPLKFNFGLRWLFSDNTANNARVYIKDESPQQ